LAQFFGDTSQGCSGQGGVDLATHKPSTFTDHSGGSSDRIRTNRSAANQMVAEKGQIVVNEKRPTC
jgi:hypothetical protein